MNKRVGSPRECATTFVHEFPDFLSKENTRISPPSWKSRLIIFIQHKQRYSIHDLFTYRVLAFSQLPVGTSINVVSQPLTRRCENYVILIDLPHFQKRGRYITGLVRRHVSLVSGVLLYLFFGNWLSVPCGKISKSSIG